MCDVGEPVGMIASTAEAKPTARAPAGARPAARREPWERNPRRWEGLPFVEEFAARRGYDLLIHGKGGPVPRTEYRYEQIPWLRTEHFVSPATTYPLDL